MRFAICDDSAADRRQLASMLQQYCAHRHVQAEIQLFADGRALLQAFTPGKYQILFLDIYMPALTGMEAAKAIREKDTGCQLVFTTTSEDHALESYGVYAAGYLLKPYTQGQLDETVDWCLENISPLAQAIEIIFERERVQVLLGEIVYIEVFGREAIFHTTGRTYGNTTGGRRQEPAPLRQTGRIRPRAQGPTGKPAAGCCASGEIHI